MKKTIKDMLFDPQVPNANIAKREQKVLMIAILLLAIVAFALHIHAQGM